MVVTVHVFSGCTQGDDTPLSTLTSYSTTVDFVNIPVANQQSSWDGGLNRSGQSDHIAKAPRLALIVSALSGARKMGDPVQFDRHLCGSAELSSPIKLGGLSQR